MEWQANHLNLPLNQALPVTLNLNPQGERVIGTDVILKFDPARLEITDVKNAGAFSTTPKVIIDNQEGVVKFSLTNGYGTYLTQAAAIAYLGVKGLLPGPTSIGFDFSPGVTTDTNVATTEGRDILTTVKTLTVTVLPAAAGQTGSGIPPGFTSPVSGNRLAEPPVILGTASDSDQAASEAAFFQVLGDNENALKEMAGSTTEKAMAIISKNPAWLVLVFGLGLAGGGALLGAGLMLYYQEHKKQAEPTVGKTW